MHPDKTDRPTSFTNGDVLKHNVKQAMCFLPLSAQRVGQHEQRLDLWGPGLHQLFPVRNKNGEELAIIVLLRSQLLT